jgi:hypothetical protein
VRRTDFQMDSGQLGAIDPQARHLIVEPPLQGCALGLEHLTHREVRKEGSPSVGQRRRTGMSQVDLRSGPVGQEHAAPDDRIAGFGERGADQNGCKLVDHVRLLLSS